MILSTIWERYFLREMTKTFLFVLFGFYGLYMLIDYSSHAQSFSNYQLTIQNILTYYSTEFSTRMNVLVPFAILIACIRTLSALNSNNELTALRASGVKLKRLLLPFVAFSILCTALLYINEEMLQPYTLQYQKQFNQLRSKAKEKKYQRQFIQQLPLEDGSSLIFKNFNTDKELFEDAYWIRSIDDIYRIQFLYPYAKGIPEGEVIEHLERNANGGLVVTKTLEKKIFPEMIFNRQVLLETITSPDKLSISMLKEKIPSHTKPLNEKELKLLTTYYYKLAQPWFCLLAVIAPAPFCIRFSRSKRIFFIYSMSIFGFFALYLIMDAAIVLAERQVISPELAIWSPICTLLAYFGYKFYRVQ